MHILIVTPYYTPDLGPSAPMFNLLSTGLLHRGHKVTVVAMVPHYPTGQVKAGYKGIRAKYSREDGVEVIRIPVPSMDRDNFIKRVIQFSIYQIGATIAIKNRKFDSAIISNPFLCSLLPLIWLSSVRKIPTIFSICDVYPDIGIKLGIFKHKLIISLVTSFERFCMDHSSIVHILSESFRPAIMKMGIADSKISLIYPWVDTEFIRPYLHDNAFSREYGLTNQFVVLYAGNIGLSQGFENILAVAKKFKERPDIRFVFVGDGAGKEPLQRLAEEEKLTNVQFIPFQPRDRLPEVLASADVSIVILRQGIGTASLPSKTFSNMASGRPILVSVERESETYELVTRANAGVWVPPENPEQFAQALLNLKEDKSLCERLGENGRTWVEQHHSSDYASLMFEKLLEQAIQNCNQ